MVTTIFEPFQKKLGSLLDTDQSEYLQPVTVTGAGGEKLQNYPSIDDAVSVLAYIIFFSSEQYYVNTNFYFNQNIISV